MYKDSNQKQGIILVHNKYRIKEDLSDRLEEEGFLVHSYSSGEIFLRSWKNNSDIFKAAVGIIIHQDLNAKSLFESSLNAESTASAKDVLTEIRAVEDGKKLRTILATGSITYKGISKELVEEYRADGVWDPISRLGEEFLPQWLIRFLKLGKVTEQEINHFRGVKMVGDQESENARETWLNYHNNNKERRNW